MLTDPGDLVFDPFGGSCITGEVSERLKRRWICAELIEEYLTGALGRFEPGRGTNGKGQASYNPDNQGNYYQVPRPSILWNGASGDALAEDGGRTRPKKIIPEVIDIEPESNEKPAAAFVLVAAQTTLDGL